MERPTSGLSVGVPALSRTRRFLSGISLGYSYQGLTMLVALWLTPFLLHHIGQHDFGVWLVGTQLLAYLSLLDIGVLTLLPRETAYMTGRAGGVEGAEGLPLLFGQMARIVLYQMPAVILALALVWVFMPSSWYGFRGPIAVIIVSFALIFPLRIFQAALQGLQDFGFVGRTQIITWAISTVVTVVLVFKGLGLYALAVGWALGQLLLLGAAAARLWRRFPGVIPRRLPTLPWTDLYSYLSRGFWITLSQFAGPLIYGVDILVIGKLLGPSAVVPYACTFKLISVLANQPNLLMAAAQPGLSELKTGGSRERVLHAITALTQALLLISGLATCVAFAINGSFVRWWVGPAQFGGMTLTALGLLSMLLRHWNTTAVYSVFCFGYERRLCLTNLLDGCVTAGVCLLLVGRVGLIGGPMSSILGVCLISLPSYLSVLKREIGVPFAALVAPLWPWFWRFAVVTALAAGAGVLSKEWGPAKFVPIAAMGACTGGLYCIVMLPMIMASSLRKYVPTKIVQRWDSLWSSPVSDVVG